MPEQRFSRETEAYLRTYEMILEEMIQGMTEAELSDSISHNFIVQMIPHHRAAIQMSRNVLKYTDNDALRQIAANIVEEQTRGIERMCEIAEGCGELRNSARELAFYQQRIDRIKNVMFYQMNHAGATERIDCDFMREMIPHHEGAVRMSTVTLQYPICRELRPVLERIIIFQERGIRQMKRLQQQINCRRL